MPNARVVGSTTQAPFGGSSPSGLTLEDVMGIIAANQAANAKTEAATKWTPPINWVVDRNQQAYAGAPDWVPGASYWKPGTKPTNVP
jgi:hypothetical protein